MLIRAADAAPTYNAETRELTLTFSSEFPVERFSWSHPELGVYDEVLLHEEKCMDDSRVRQRVCPFLDSHYPSQRLGRVLSVWIEDRKGQATVRLNKNKLATDFIGELETDTQTGISFGYRPRELDVVKMPKFNDKGEQTQKAVCHVTSWEILEISTAAIPADPTVGARQEDQQFDLDADVVIRGLTSVKSEKGGTLMTKLTGEATADTSLHIDDMRREIEALKTALSEKDTTIATLTERQQNLQIGLSMAALYAKLRRTADEQLKKTTLTRGEYDKLFPESAEEGLTIEGADLAALQKRMGHISYYLEVSASRSPQLPTSLTEDQIVQLSQTPIDRGEDDDEAWANTFFQEYKLPSLY